MITIFYMRTATHGPDAVVTIEILTKS